MALQLITVDVAYQSREIFSNFNYCFSANSWHVILGKSGAGKSTLLRAIAGLIPFSGIICDQNGASLAGRVSLMAQNNDLFPWLSALENVMLGARLRGEKPNIQRARELLTAVGLTDFYQPLPNELSGGQRQRVALARTLYENRPVVLMDEPFSAVDAVTRYQLQNLAADLLKNQTVIMITHDPAEALRLADHLYILENLPAILREQPVPETVPPRDDYNSTLLLQALAESHD